MFCSAQETMKLLPSCDNVGGTCGVHAPTRPAEPLHPHPLGRVDPRRRRGLDDEYDDARNALMPSKNERVELEMKIMRYRQLVDRTADEEFLRRRNQIAET